MAIIWMCAGRKTSTERRNSGIDQGIKWRQYYGVHPGVVIMPIAESLYKRDRAQPTQDVPVLFLRQADGPGGLLILCSWPRGSRLTEPQLEAIRDVSQQIITTGDVPSVCWVTMGGDISPIPKPDPAWVRRWVSLYSAAII